MLLLAAMVVGGMLARGDEPTEQPAAPKPATKPAATIVVDPEEIETPVVRPSPAPRPEPAARIRPARVASLTGEYRLADEELDDAVAAALNSSEAGTAGRVFGQPGALTGDIKGLGPSISAGLEGLALALGKDLVVISGARTFAEQQVLYARFQAGTGNLAAVPGTSRHETGEAADVYVDGVALADVPGARRAAAMLGLGFPVPGEPWHVERVSSPRG